MSHPVGSPTVENRWGGEGGLQGKFRDPGDAENRSGQEKQVLVTGHWKTPKV